MNVLSLFDGMGCGMLAMITAKIPIDNYYAYEIDKYAVKTAKHNFPHIEEKGNVFDANFTVYEGIDYLIGGSPCTYWSIAQSPDKRETTASGLGWELFSQYVRAIKEAKPKYFIYENNKSMARAIYESICETFGFEAIMINSALVSAQNRQRYYWVGKRNADGTYSKVDIEQPKDKGILLKDVLDGVVDREKSRAIIGSIGRTTPREYLTKNQGQVSFEPVNASDEGKAHTLKAQYSKTEIKNICCHFAKFGATGVAEPVGMASRGRNPSGEYEQQYEARSDGKSNAMTTVQKDCMVGEPVCMRYERNETAKALRIDYEAGRIHHGRNEHKELQPRPDGKSNTLTTVLKDNPICEPVIFNRPRGKNNGGFSADKSPTVTASRWEENHEVCEPVGCVQVGAMPRPNGKLSKSQGFRIYDINAKPVTLKGNSGGAGGKTGLYAIPVEWDGDEPTQAVSTSDGKTHKVYKVENGMICYKDKPYPIGLADGYYIIRKLMVSECKRLQTVPEWYHFPVSDTQAYKMLGNGWTIDVIVHLLEATKKLENS